MQLHPSGFHSWLYTDSGDNALRPLCLSKTSSVSFDAHISLILKESRTFNSFGDFKLESTENGLKFDLTHYKLAGLCRCGTIGKFQNGTPKVANKPLLWGWPGNQFVTMVTRLVCSSCGAYLIDFWYKLAEILLSSQLIKIQLGLWWYHLANLQALKLEYEVFVNRKQSSSHTDHLFIC